MLFFKGVHLTSSLGRQRQGPLKEHRAGMIVVKQDRDTLSLWAEGQVDFLPQSMGCSDRVSWMFVTPTVLEGGRLRSRGQPGLVYSPLLRTWAPKAQGSSLTTEPACIGIPGVAPGTTPRGEELRLPGQEMQKHWPHSIPDQGSLLPAANWGSSFCPLLPREDVRAFGIFYRTQLRPNPDPPAPATRSLPTSSPRHPELCPTISASITDVIRP